MIKNVKWIFVVLIISSLISFSFVGKDTPTEGLTIGDKAPTFTICGEKQLIDAVINRQVAAGALMHGREVNSYCSNLLRSTH